MNVVTLALILVFNVLHDCSMCLGEGNGTPLQYSCLENPMGRGAWWAAVHGVSKGQTWLSDFTFTFHFPLSTLMHWRRKWQLTPVFLPEESQGQRTLVGWRPWGRTESDTTEVTWQQQQHTRITGCPCDCKVCQWWCEQKELGRLRWWGNQVLVLSRFIRPLTNLPSL